jgi:hypothetical protein
VNTAAGGVAPAPVVDFAPGMPQPFYDDGSFQQDYRSAPLTVLGGSLSGRLGGVQVQGPSVQHYGNFDSWSGAYPGGYLNIEVSTTGTTGAGMMMLTMDGDISTALSEAMDVLESGAEGTLLEAPPGGQLSVIGCSGATLGNWDWDTSTQDASVEMSLDPADPEAVVFELDAQFEVNSRGTSQLRVARRDLQAALAR